MPPLDESEDEVTDTDDRLVHPDDSEFVIYIENLTHDDTQGSFTCVEPAPDNFIVVPTRLLSPLDRDIKVMGSSGLGLAETWSFVFVTDQNRNLPRGGF